MQFLEPGYLWLLPPLLLGVWWGGRRMLGMGRARKRLVLALRMVLVLLLVLTLAGPQAVQPNKGTCVVFAVDMSDSISGRGRAASKEFLRQSVQYLGREDQIAIVAFGRDALVDMTPTSIRTLPPIYSKPDPSGTNIAAALRLASALFPDGKHRRIVLLTDGNETEGSALESAMVASTEGIEIDVVSLASAQPEKEALVLEVQSPNTVKIGEPFQMRVVIESRTHAEGVLHIDCDGVPVTRVRVTLTPGKNVVVVPIRTEREGFYRYRVLLEASPDTDVRNNQGRAFVKVQGKPKVLLAEGGSQDRTRALERALRANNLDVVLANELTFPARASEVQAYDAVILNDFPATALTPQQMLMLQSAVRDTGIGFAMIGGQNSFLSGGYYETPIAEMLPVDLDVRQRKIFPPATVVIIVDISGSMAMEEAGIPKIQLAAKAAVESLKLLRPQDRFGVIVSGTGVDWLTPIQSATNKEGTIARVMQMTAGGGGIYVRPSLEFAMRALATETTTVRHVILLADGDDCDEQDGCFQIGETMRRMGITMSVVSLGRGKDVEFLKQLARVSGGNFYLTERARNLPRLFTADVSLMTRSAIEEGAFIPKVAMNDEILQGIAWHTTPPLLAYNLTSDRPLARTLMRTHKDDPLLAIWQYGLGTALAFTSDAKPRWAQAWVGWSEFAPFWTQLTRAILRKSSRQDYQLTVRPEGGQAIVELQAFTPQGEPINFLQPEMRVSTPTGENLTLTLQQAAPGRYQGRFPLREIGDYLLTLVEREPDGTMRTLTSGFAVPYPSEYRFTRANLPLLTRIAELTGGKVNPQPTELFRAPKRRGSSVRDLWQSFLWLALLLLLTDITLRRVVIPFPAIWGWVRSVARRVVGLRQVRRPVPQPTASTRLLYAKERVRASDPSAPPTVSPTPMAPPPTNDTPPPRSPTPTTPQETTSRLLEIKKRTRGQ